MSLLFDLALAVYDQPLAVAIRESEVVFPLIQIVHMVGVALMAGTIAVVDFRLLGWIWADQRVSYVSSRLTPYTWAGFLVMLVSGGVLLAVQSVKIFANVPLRLKLVLLAAAAVNMAVYHLAIYRRVTDWDVAEVTPVPARTAAALSLLLWTGVIVTGRLIAYF